MPTTGSMSMHLTEWFVKLFFYFPSRMHTKNTFSFSLSISPPTEQPSLGIPLRRTRRNDGPAGTRIHRHLPPLPSHRTRCVHVLDVLCELQGTQHGVAPRLLHRLEPHCGRSKGVLASSHGHVVRVCSHCSSSPSPSPSSMHLYHFVSSFFSRPFTVIVPLA